jgi:acetoacetyl-CoA synthetase
MDDVELVSSVLASKASIVLFDGSPMFKKDDLLLKLQKKKKLHYLELVQNI